MQVAHTAWVQKYGASKGWPQGSYLEMIQKASVTGEVCDCLDVVMLIVGAETVDKFNKKQRMSRDGLLREALKSLSASAEAYLTTRSHFARTMATLSVCQYILGIGDRHLSNFMIDTTRYDDWMAAYKR